MAETAEFSLLSGGEAIVDRLVEHGVDTVFGIPGIQLDPLFDAFHARSNAVRMVHTRHEQGAAFMALGYAQASGRPGVFAAVPGPGLLNAMAAVSTAVAADQPVLALTGQIPSYQIGGGLGMAHELKDQLSMAAGVVDWAGRANHPSEVPALLDAAFVSMLAGRRRPAVFEMPPDRLAVVAPVATGAPVALPSAPVPHPERIAEAAARLASAERPAIFVGGGVAGAEEALRRLAERLQAPVIASVSGRGALSDDHPLAFGILTGQRIWEEIDVALVVGTRFVAPALAWGRSGEVATVRIDIDPVQIAKPRPASVSLVTSAARGMEALLEALPEARPLREAYLERCAEHDRAAFAELGRLGPLPALSEAVRRAVPRDGIVVTDVTQLGYYMRYAAPVYEPRTMLGPGYQATLGYALPAAMGAKLARPEARVVALCGDGGLMFTVPELATAVHHRIPVVTVVLDNASYGNVKTIQAQSYGARHIGVELTNPDFVALARSFGMHAERAGDASALESALERAFDLDGPALIEVPIGEVPSIWDLIRRPPSQGVAGG